MHYVHLRPRLVSGLSLLLPNLAPRVHVEFLCRKCFLIATKIPVCGKGEPSSSPSLLSSPNRSCLCGQHKIDTLLENFKSSQGFVRGWGAMGKERENGLTSKKPWFFCWKPFGGWELWKNHGTRGKETLENKFRLMALGEGWKTFKISSGQCFPNSCERRKQSGFKLQEFFSLVKIPEKHLQLQGWYLTPFKTD